MSRRGRAVVMVDGLGDVIAAFPDHDASAVRFAHDIWSRGDRLTVQVWEGPKLVHVQKWANGKMVEQDGQPLTKGIYRNRQTSRRRTSRTLPTFTSITEAVRYGKRCRVRLRDGRVLVGHFARGKKKR